MPVSKNLIVYLSRINFIYHSLKGVNVEESIKLFDRPECLGWFEKR